MDQTTEGAVRAAISLASSGRCQTCREPAAIILNPGPASAGPRVAMGSACQTPACLLRLADLIDCAAQVASAALRRARR